MSALNNYAKGDLVAIGRKLGIVMGDYARAKKEELIQTILAGASEDDALLAAGTLATGPAAGLIVPGAAGGGVKPVTAVPERPDFSGVCVIGTKSAAEVFGIKGKNAQLFAGRMVDIWNDPAAPKPMDNFRWRPMELLACLNSMARGGNIWLGGPAGTGKTEFVKQLAARLGRAFIRVQFNSGVEAYDIIGGERVKAGTSYWQDGIVLQAYRRPGAIVLLDEIGFARSEYTSDLHAALEPDGAITVACTGEVISKAPGVAFFAADNSNGRGDATGTYVGITEKNEAFLSRFARSLKFDYMPAADEVAIVCDVAKCTKQLARLVVQFLSVCRSKATTGLLESPPSMREAFALAQALTDGEPARYAFETTIVNRASIDSQEILQQTWVSNVSDDIVAAAMRGESVSLMRDADTINIDLE